MIPKKIHYCWFGKGELPELAQKCIASWEKYCPDYEIIQWNEDNFDVARYPFASFCLDNKKYAFLSDYVRLIVVEQYGGFYFDTDVELVENINHLLQYDGVFGFEDNESVNTGQGFGAVAHHSFVKEMIDVYDSLESDQNGDYRLEPCPNNNTKALLKLGLIPNGQKQIIDNVIILPADYTNPFDNNTGVLNKTKNTISIHWYSKSWLTKREIIRSKLTRPIHRIFGVNSLSWLKKLLKKQ